MEGLHTMMKRKAFWVLLAAGMTVVSTQPSASNDFTAEFVADFDQ
jgi:hypothetical protein